jgi:hypothetical protein
VNVELERIWKESDLRLLKVLLQHLPEATTTNLIQNTWPPGPAPSRIISRIGNHYTTTFSICN